MIIWHLDLAVDGDTVALGLLLALVVWRSPRGRLLATAGVVVCHLRSFE